jgi:transposase
MRMVLLPSPRRINISILFFEKGTTLVSIHTRGLAFLDAWFDNGIEPGISQIMRFSLTLHHDIDAVRNAIDLSSSPGLAEGQINCLKTPKRAAYVRVYPDWLKARILPLRRKD